MERDSGCVTATFRGCRSEVGRQLRAGGRLVLVLSESVRNSSGMPGPPESTSGVSLGIGVRDTGGTQPEAMLELQLEHRRSDVTGGRVGDDGCGVLEHEQARTGDLSR
jgi:hypothetical protein